MALDSLDPLTAPMPAPPVRQFSFTDFQTNNPTAPPPGDRLDAEFDRANNAIEGTIAWANVSLNTDGTLRDAIVGESNLQPDLFDDIASDAIAQVQPLVDQAAAYSASAGSSSVSASSSATTASAQAVIAQGAAGRANNAQVAAEAARDASQGYASAAQTAATGAANADNDAQGAAALAQDYAVVTQAWAEHMPDPIPPNILAVMGVTGDHWSSRWWANQAAAAFGALTSLYLGAFPQPPTQTPTGGAIPIGAIYYNTTSGQPFVWNGAGWVPFYAPTKAVTLSLAYSANGSQTAFPLTTVDLAGNSYTMNATTPEPIDVFVNGVRLLLNQPAGVGDWNVNAANSTVTLTAAPRAGSVVQMDVLTPTSALAASRVQTQPLEAFSVNGTTTTFPLYLAGHVALTVASSIELFVSIDGVVQQPGVDFSAVGSSITFTEAPAANAKTWGFWYGPSTFVYDASVGGGMYLPLAGGTLTGPLTNGALTETASDLQPARHLSNLIGKSSAVVCIIGDSTATEGPVQVGTAGGATTANGVDQSQMLWAMLCDKLRTDNPQITSWTFTNFAIGGTAENAPLSTGTDLAVNQAVYPWFTDLSKTWLSYVQAAQPDVLFYLFGTNASAAGAPPLGGGGGPGASTFLDANLQAVDAWTYTPNIVIVTNKTSSPADATAGPDDANNSNHFGQASFHRTFARSGAAGYTDFPKCKAKGFGLVDLGRYAASRLYGYDPAAQYMRAVASAIVVGKPLVNAQLNVAGPGTVAKSTHGDFRLTFVLRGMGGGGLNALGISAIDIGMSNFVGNSIRLQIGSPYGTGYLWPMYLVDGNIFGAPSQMGTAILTAAGQDVVITASASGSRIRVWINGVLALNVIGARFVTPTAGGGCPINVLANVAPAGSPTFDVTEFYEGVGSPTMMTMDYASTFGTHVQGGGTTDGFQGGNSVNHQTSLSASYDRRVISAMNFGVPASIPLPGGLTMPVNAANDAAAASAGIAVGGIYRNGSVLQIRVS